MSHEQRPFDSETLRHVAKAVAVSYAENGASYYMKAYEHRVDVDTTGGAVTIYLPPVAESAGCIYSIRLRTDGGNTCYVDDLGDDPEFIKDDMGDVRDGLLWYSDGVSWYRIGELT